MEQTYVDIMIQSLNKKIQVLDKIMELNEVQKAQLEDVNTLVDDFDKTVEEKGKLIEQLEQLDSGFDKLYDRVKECLLENKTAYASKIKILQTCIREITDKSMQIQTQEARNKEAMQRKFAYVKEKAKVVRANGKAVNNYYKNMMGLNYIEPQFMDTKSKA